MIKLEKTYFKMARLRSTLISQVDIFQFIQLIYKDSSESLKAGFRSPFMSFPGFNFGFSITRLITFASTGHLLKIRNHAGLLPLPPIYHCSLFLGYSVIFKSPVLTPINCENLYA